MTTVTSQLQAAGQSLTGRSRRPYQPAWCSTTRPVPSPARQPLSAPPPPTPSRRATPAEAPLLPSLWSRWPHHRASRSTSSSITAEKGTSITPVVPTASGGPVASWSITPMLPAGLTFNTSTGEINGTPTAVSPLTTYTITATNAGGSGWPRTIAVNDVAPAMSYTPDDLEMTNNTASSDLPLAPTVSALARWSPGPSVQICPAAWRSTRPTVPSAEPQRNFSSERRSPSQEPTPVEAPLLT